MSLEKEQTQFQALDNWFLSDQGLNAAQAFIDEIAPIRSMLQGNFLVQLSNCGSNLWLHEMRYLHKWVVAPYLKKDISFVSLFQYIPLSRDSVDCVIAPLTLETFLNKTILLDEIDRVLKPSGYVVFWGVNPLSLWGYWLSRGKETCFGAIKGHCKSLLSVKRAMINHGYIQCHLSNFYYIPPVKSKKWLSRFEIFNEIGKMVSPMPSAFYCLVMQKTEQAFIPLAKARQGNFAVSVSTPQPTCLIRPTS